MVFINLGSINELMQQRIDAGYKLWAANRVMNGYYHLPNRALAPVECQGRTPNSRPCYLVAPLNQEEEIGSYIVFKTTHGQNQ